MPTADRWSVVDLGTHDYPVTLVKVKLDTTGYTIHLTDLCRIWEERLSRQEVIARALESHCDIDPSEDDQCQILLDKIGDALDGKAKTLVVLKPHGENGLELQLNAPLPAPLSPLQWNIMLAPLPQIATRSSLVQPLLSELSTLQTCVSDLISELADKDRVISKITDRLEASGNDLTTVFPGVSNIRRSHKMSQRAQLSRHVRGLGDFDEAAWRARHEQAMDFETSADAIDSLFSALPAVSIDSLQTLRDHWWRPLESAKPARIREKPDIRAPKSPVKPVSAHESPVSDDEFQRQATPPGVSSIGDMPDQTSADNLNNVDEDTTDDEDLDAKKPEVDRPNPAKLASSNPQPLTETKAAVIRNPSTATNDHVQEGFVPRGASSKVETEKLNAEADSEEEISDKRGALPLSSRPKTSSKLGTLGGRKKTAPPEQITEHSEQPRTVKPKAKLGRLGGKRQHEESPQPSSQLDPVFQSSAADVSSSDTMAGDTDEKQPAVSDLTDRAKSDRKQNGHQQVDADSSGQRGRTELPETTPATRETSAERANRRRDELRQEMEAKAKAPVKKKRKF